MDDKEGKICAKCGEWKPADTYHKSARTGLQSRCIPCRSRRTKPMKPIKPRVRYQGGFKVPVIEGNRECTRCKVTKPVVNFWNDPRNQYGVSTICKECHSKKRREQYAAKPRVPIVHIILPERPCRSCGVVKPLKDYYYDGRSIDGHAKECRDCYRSNLFKGIAIIPHNE